MPPETSRLVEMAALGVVITGFVGMLSEDAEDDGERE
jgi:hypothetical protein